MPETHLAQTSMPSGISVLAANRCYKRIKAAYLAGLPEYTETCGKCQVLLPCSLSPGED